MTRPDGHLDGSHTNQLGLVHLGSGHVEGALGLPGRAQAVAEAIAPKADASIRPM